ncbi:MAG: YncE family protein [Carboxydocellales bacterium]
MKLNMLGIMKICRLLILGLVLAGLGLLIPGQAIAESILLPRAYICNYYDDSVSVIDVATNSVIDTVYGFSGPRSVAVKPDGTEVNVANNNSSKTVSVINTATNTITANLTVGLNPQAMTRGTDGVNLYVVAG